MWSWNCETLTFYIFQFKKTWLYDPHVFFQLSVETIQRLLQSRKNIWLTTYTIICLKRQTVCITMQ